VVAGCRTVSCGSGTPPPTCGVQLRGHNNASTRWRSNADGKWLVTAGRDQAVKVWDWKEARTDTSAGMTTRSNGRVLSHAKGERLLSAGATRTCAFGIRPRKSAHSNSLASRMALSVAFSPESTVDRVHQSKDMTVRGVGLRNWASVDRTGGRERASESRSAPAFVRNRRGV